jgi:hypothetical protein
MGKNEIIISKSLNNKNENAKEKEKEKVRKSFIYDLLALEQISSMARVCMISYDTPTYQQHCD